MARRFDKTGGDERRKAFAHIYGLGESASWTDIDRAAQSTDERVEQHVSDLKADILALNEATSEPRRTDAAIRHGLGPNASWDDIYNEWKRDWGYGRLVRLVLAVAGVPAVFILSISTHWIAISIVAALIFLVTLGLLAIHGLSLEDEYHGFVRQNPEVFERAKRDKILS